MTLNKSSDLKGISHFTIVKILKKFSPRELTDFEKLLNSPFFNNHSTVTKLFHELKNFYPKFSDKILTKEFLFEIINPGKIYDDMLFQKYVSRMNKLAEEYLSILELRDDQKDKELKVLYQLSKRDLKEVYSRKINEIEKDLEKNSKLDEDFYLFKHKLSEIKYYHKTRGNNVISGNKELIESYKYLIIYFLSIASYSINQLFSDKYSFKYSELLCSSGIFFNRFEIEKNLADFIKNTPTNDKKNLLFLELIRNDLNMSSEKENLNAYKKLRKIVFENADALSDTLLLYFLKRFNVYCIIENAKGIYDLQKDLFENYKVILEKKLFLLKGIPDLRYLDYRIILFTALKINETDWVEEFINDSVSLIKEESRENIINFGYAFLMFHKKNYSESLDHISMIKYELFPITIDIYALKTKIFFELGFYDTALSVADSFRNFLKSNRLISDFLKNGYFKYLKIFTVLVKLKNNYSESKHKNLLFELDSSSEIASKKWLFEKLNGLI